MKKVVTVQEVDGEGLEALLDTNVLIYALSYIYAGKLTGVNTTCILLTDAKIVYETGPFSSSGYTDAQALPGGKIYIMQKNIESFGPGK
jgi:hypothetical protein